MFPLSGLEVNHKGHKEHEGELLLPFVIFVLFVVLSDSTWLD